MKLVIDRTKWLRGEGAIKSRLLRPGDGKMCCLGFYGLACGASEATIENQFCPVSIIYGRISGFPDWITGNSRWEHSEDCKHLMEWNDDQNLPPDTREECIKQGFANHGVEVEFVN